MARPKRFELLTPRFVVWCSIQLSYGRLIPLPETGARDRGIAIVLTPHWQGLRPLPAFRRGRVHRVVYLNRPPGQES